MRRSLSLMLLGAALLALNQPSAVRADEELEEGEEEDDRSQWADSPVLTQMWQAINGKDMEKLKTILDDNPSAIDERASDGRGPLWWAYEYKSDEAVELLQKYGVDEKAKDADGKTAKQLADETAGRKTAFMLRKEENEAAEAAKRAAEMGSTISDSAQLDQMYQLFSVRSTCTDAELDAAYKEQATRYQPANLSPGADREQTEQTLRYLTQVYNSLVTYRKAQPPPGDDNDYEDEDEEEEEEDDDYNDEL